MSVRSFGHIGVVVDDLEAATAFFLDLGFTRRGGSESLEGRWIDGVVGLDGVRVDLVVVSAPDGSGELELTRFHTPVDDHAGEPGTDQAPANRPGLRHIAFLVDDLRGMVDRLREQGVGLVGGIRDYEDTYRLCYVRGPEGIIVELAEDISAGRERD